MRRVSAIVLALGVAAAPTAASARPQPHWSRPTTLGYDSGGVEPYLQPSPDRRRMALVDDGLVRRTLFRLRRRDGSFGGPIRVPGRRSEISFSDLAIADGGTIAVGWNADAPNRPRDYDGYCWCRARAVVRRTHGGFGPVRTLSGPGDRLETPAVDVGPDGRTTAFWRSYRRLRVATASRAGSWNPSRTVVADVDDWDIATDTFGRDVLEWRVRRDWRAAPAPFTRSAAIPAPGYRWIDEPAVAGNGRGYDVRISVDERNYVVAQLRRVGTRFGRRHRIARARGRSPLCEVGAAMNAHRRVLATWVCEPDGGEIEGTYARGALLSRHGRVTLVSGAHAAWPATNGTGADLDDQGRGAATFVEPNGEDLFSLVVTRGRVRGFRALARADVEGAAYIPVAIDARGQAMAAWASYAGAHGEAIRVATIDLRTKR